MLYPYYNKSCIIQNLQPNLHIFCKGRGPLRRSQGFGSRDDDSRKESKQQHEILDQKREGKRSSYNQDSGNLGSNDNSLKMQIELPPFIK